MPRPAAALTLLPLALAAGCTTSAPTADRDPGLGGGDAAADHAALFQNPQVTASLRPYSAEELPEYTRRDETLGARAEGPVLATSQWPTEPRASLSDLRVIYLPVYTGTSYAPITYFEPGAGAYRSYGRRWSYRYP